MSTLPKDKNDLQHGPDHEYHDDEYHDHERPGHEGHDHSRHGHAGHGHSHAPGSLSGRKIFWVTILNLVITIAEVIGGLLSGSLALLSDSLHNLSDTVAVALSFFANKVAQRPKNPRRTYGYKRAEILAAMLNSLALLGISTYLIIEAVQRWWAPETIDSTLMMIVATIGLVANLVSVVLLERDSHTSLNIKSSYLHLVSDAVSSVGVIVGALAIRFWGIVWIDPLITLIIALYIIFRAWQMLRNIVDILMQTSANLDYDAIRREICAIEHVRNLHHVHSWMINESTIFFEAHVTLDEMPLSMVQTINERIEQLLVERYGISHVTLQSEIVSCEGDSCRI